ncbi:class I SAM-dependent methyltransferase [Microvirga sp. P5_D2]
MGRWSRRIAPIFTAWLNAPAGAAWADVGCGTGVLTEAILAQASPSRIVGIDSSTVFVEAARSRLADSRVSLKQGDAQDIPEASDSFDVAVSGLVLNFVPDKEVMIREMARVVRPGGTVALYVWDYAGHIQIMRNFFDTAIAFDLKAREFDDGIKAPICRPQPLMKLLAGTGMRDVTVRPIDIPAAFESFDDYWTPILGGTGSAPKYCASLSEEARGHLREALRKRLPAGPDGAILLAVRAWAVKGQVPERG